MRDDKMVWIDMETTGLDCRIEVPLEIGLAVTDNYGQLLGEAAISYLIWEDTPHFAERVDLARVHEVVGPMHEASGLWDQILNQGAPVYSTNEIDKRLAHWLIKAEADGAPLAGSSIGSLDRPFLQTFFPMTNETLHYRNIDNSTIKELCKRHNPRVYRHLDNPDMGPVKEGGHRALSDIQDSVAEYQYYLDNFLFCGEDTE